MGREPRNNNSGMRDDRDNRGQDREWDRNDEYRSSAERGNNRWQDESGSNNSQNQNSRSGNNRMNADYGEAWDYGRQQGGQQYGQSGQQYGQQYGQSGQQSGQQYGQRSGQRDDANRPWSGQNNNPPNGRSYSSDSNGYGGNRGSYAPDFGAGDMWGGVDSAQGRTMDGSNSRSDWRNGRVGESSEFGNTASWNNGRYPQGGMFQGGMSQGGMSQGWPGSTSRGEHFGKGPKGYQRSDERVKEIVCERLEAHPDLDASEIDIEVKSGVVTLTGTVQDRQAKRMAEDASEGLPGVKDVLNQLQVSKQTNGMGQQANRTGQDQAGQTESTQSRSGQGQSSTPQTAERQKTGSGRS